MTRYFTNGAGFSVNARTGIMEIPENPYWAKIVGRRAEEIDREDLIRYHDFEMRIYRALPDRVEVQVGVIGGGLRTYAFTKGKAVTMQKAQDWFEMILNKIDNFKTS